MRLTTETKRGLIRLVLEIILYAFLVVVYLFLILRFLGPELVLLFKQNLVLYAGLALGLMVFQGIFLETVTTFLIDRLEL
jgi:hypothetical protein